MIGWNSRRSSVLSTKGICASSQPLASQVGINILQKGGNAADAAIAMAAALNVTEPCSTGLGGDAFALYYYAKTGNVTCLQGNGASPAALTLQHLNSIGIGKEANLQPLNERSALCVTVPGAAALWEDLLLRHGNMNFAQVLEPAIELAENGFPVAPVTAEYWSEEGYFQGEEANRVFRPNNSPVTPGQLFRNPDLANTFRSLAEHGAKKGFYSGRIAEAIVEAVREFGGVLTLEDMAEHMTTFEEPISTVYKGIRVYQTPPPSQGLTVLLALNYIEAMEQRLGIEGADRVYSKDDFDFSRPDLDKRSDGDVLHMVIECMRRAFADGLEHIGDPRHSSVPTSELLSREYARHRVGEISMEQTTRVKAGNISFFTTGETVYFCVVDREGNACSFINSNFKGFGTGIVPKGTGFTLQNRGYNFSLVEGHANQVGPKKKPYHTIIPSLATYASDGSLYGVFGNMGGFMQPMGHLQLIRNLIDYRFDPQRAIDSPRWYLNGTGDSQSPEDMWENELLFEEGYGDEKDVGIYSQRVILEVLHGKGQKIGPAVKGKERILFGKAQAILRDPKTGVLWAGSDPRSDGCAIPLI